MQKTEDEPEDNVDYMHPDGKPPVKTKPAEEKFDGRELEAAARREKSALIDADGHHICSSECHRKHKK